MIFFGFALLAFFAALALALVFPRFPVGRASVVAVALGFFGALLTLLGAPPPGEDAPAFWAGLGGLMMVIAVLGLMVSFILWLWQLWLNRRGS